MSGLAWMCAMIVKQFAEITRAGTMEEPQLTVNIRDFEYRYTYSDASSIIPGDQRDASHQFVSKALGSGTVGRQH